MHLLSQEITASVPLLYATEETAIADKMVYAKLFDPFSQWICYVCEYDQKERLRFGYVAQSRLND